jgi:hypothetical protein
MDRRFGAQMRLLPEEIPAWVVDSPENHPIVVELWDSRKRWAPSGMLTSFLDNTALTPEQRVISLLDTIDLHQGIYSQDPAWNVAQIIGVDPTLSLIEAMKSLGFDSWRSGRHEIEFRQTGSAMGRARC